MVLHAFSLISIEHQLGYALMYLHACTIHSLYSYTN